ncbi:alpha/beta hydrolase [Dactylosporangium sp. NPDC051541]|uniref:alpha/beta hydrolase n=1 Tax=Dactylosporangium sp. NPDC051541 TaxID=3363977 RepID=UPI0037953D39
MSIVDELKQFGAGHARAQDIPTDRLAELYARISTDGDGAGSWVREWSRAADELSAAGQHLAAAQHYNMARLPYVDGPARQEAQDSCVAAFGRWAQDGGVITPLEVEVDGARVRCWTAGLSAEHPRPVLLALGGIVSVKEQWAPLLSQAARLGLAGVVTEMPGVGENTLPYGRDSAKMLSAVLDAIVGRADVARTYAMALSFSGHLALRCALTDPRIRGIATIGAPLHAFFTDRAWQDKLPSITVDTLAHLIGVDPADVGEHVRDWALRPEELAALDIPVGYVASDRDEIIPAADIELARTHLKHLRLLRFDDVHGSPNHADETRMWIVGSILRMSGAPVMQRAAVGVAGGLIRIRRMLTPSTRLGERTGAGV